MKFITKAIVCVMCLFSFINSEAKLVDTTYKANDVKPFFLGINPQYAIISSMGYEFELLNKNQNVGHTLFMAFKNQKRQGIQNFSKQEGVLLEYKAKYYPNGINTKKTSISQYNWGLYIAPIIQAGFWNLETNTETFVNQQSASIIKSGSLTTVAPGFVIGLKKSLLKGLYIDFYMGGLVRYNQDPSGLLNEDNYDISTMYHSGLIPKIGMSFGVNL